MTSHERLKSLPNQLFVQQYVYNNMKENIRAMRYRSFVRGFPLIIPLEKSQLSGKRSHVMTASCNTIAVDKLAPWVTPFKRIDYCIRAHNFDIHMLGACDFIHLWK